MQVSSKHLSLASVVFKKMLEGDFWESATLRSAGHVTIHLPDDDPEAITIILNICHLRIKQVPYTVDKHTLVWITRLVDKYCCHEAVERFAIDWIDEMPDPNKFWISRDYAEAMAINWCFDRSRDLEGTVESAILEIRGNLESDNLPVPSRCLGMSSLSLLSNARGLHIN